MKSVFSAAIKRFKLAHRSIRIGTYIVAAYASYALLIGLALPAAIESQLPKQLHQFIGRDVSVQDIKVNPFLLRIEVNDFMIAESDGINRFVHFKQLKTQFNFWQSIITLTPTLEYFSLIEPQVQLTRLSQDSASTRFNFTDIIEHIAALPQKSSSEIKQEESNQTVEKVFPFKALTINLSNAAIDIHDRQTGVTLGYQDINFELNELDTQAQVFDAPQKSVAATPLPTNQFVLELSGSDKSRIESNGQFQLQPLLARGNIGVSSIQLPPLWPLSENIISANLSRGAINFNSHFSVSELQEQINIQLNQGRFSIDDLAFEYDGKPKVKLDELALDGIKISTADKQVDLQELSVTGLWGDAALNSKGVDLPRYFTPTNREQKQVDVITSEPSESDTSQDAAWRVNLEKFALIQADLNLEDRFVSDNMHWRIFPLDFETGALNSDLTDPIHYKLDLAIGSEFNKAPTKARGQYSVEGLADLMNEDFVAQMKLVSLDLTQFQRYIAPHLNLIVDNGTLSTQGSLSANSKGKAIFQGQSSIDNLVIKDVLEKEPLLKWESMSLEALHFDQQKKRLKIDTILFNKPYAKVLVTKDRLTNIGQITKKQESVEAESKKTEAQKTEGKKASSVTSSQSAEPQVVASTSKEKQGSDKNTLSLDIDKIAFINGSAFFADYSLVPNFASGIEMLEGSIQHISSNPQTRAKVDIKGKIDKYAPVTILGEVNPLAQPPYLDLDFKLESAELTSVSPYSGLYAGYYIDKGQLSIDINYRLENNILEGENNVVVDQLTLGKRSESDLATSLPVTLAIGLLKDTDGVIDLGFGVSGDVNSPDFSFGGAILTVLENLITKAVTAPFSLLADMVGSDEELDYVEFEPGTSELNEAGEQKIVLLAKALNARPNLNLSVEGSVSIKDDSAKIAEDELQQKLLKKSGLARLPEDVSASRIPDTGPLKEALEVLAVEELKIDLAQERLTLQEKVAEPEQISKALSISLYNQLLSAQDVSYQELGELAQERAKAIKTSLLVNKVQANRVFIMDSKTKLKTEEHKALLTIDSN